MEQHGLATFDELLQRSTTDLEWFWNAVLKFLDIQFYEPYSQVVDLSQGIDWPQWCVGGVMNIVHNCLDKWIGTPDENKAALICESEDGRPAHVHLRRALSRGQQDRECAAIARAWARATRSACSCR